MRRRPGTPARSIRWRPACCRSRSARRPRPCPTPWTAQKHYRFTVRWGAETDTDDAEGERRRDERRAARSRDAIEALLPQLHRRDHAGAAGVLGHQGRRRPRLRPGAQRRGGRCSRRGRCTSTRSTLIEHAGRRHRRVRGRLRQGHLRARAGARHGPRARLPRPRRSRCGARASAPSTRPQAVTLQALRGRGRAGRRTPCSACCCRSRPRCSDLVELSVGQNDAARLLRGQPVLIRGRDAPIGGGADLRHLQGPPDRRRPHREGELHPIRVFNFGEGR